MRERLENLLVGVGLISILAGGLQNRDVNKFIDNPYQETGGQALTEEVMQHYITKDTHGRFLLFTGIPLVLLGAGSAAVRRRRESYKPRVEGPYEQ